MDIQKIKELALANGFSLKEQASGNIDLHSYVYEFAQAVKNEVLAQARSVFNQEAVTINDTEFLDAEITQISNSMSENHFLDYEESEELEMLVTKAMKLGELYERKKWQEAKAIPEATKYFSYDGNNYEFHNTLAEAKHEAEHAIEYFRDCLADQQLDPESDGNFQRVSYGVVLAESGYSVDHVVTQEDVDNGTYPYEVGTEIMSLFLTENQSTPEGFVLVPKEKIESLVDGLHSAFQSNPTLTLGDLLPLQQDFQAMIEAQE